jgi:uncharacterized protein YkwD
MRLALSLAVFMLVTATLHAGSSESVAARAVISEINLARTHPAQYAALIQERRSHFQNNMLVRPGHVMLRTREGTGALDDAIRFLLHATPLSPLALSPGMCRAAADHCADQAGGRTGHKDRDWSGPGERLNRYGRWSTLAGENVAYGERSAREIVMALVIDDGVRGRGHRKNIFNPMFAFAGAACGPHARYRSVCSIEFAAAYAERDGGGTLVARNP